MRANAKAGHMSDIMLVYKQFKVIRRTVEPTDSNRFHGDQLVSKKTGKDFPSMCLKVSIS